jgi:hypothetical protein
VTTDFVAGYKWISLRDRNPAVGPRVISIDSSVSAISDSVNGNRSAPVMTDDKDRTKKARTGVPGLDDVLSGGLALAGR